GGGGRLVAWRPALSPSGVLCLRPSSTRGFRQATALAPGGALGRGNGPLRARLGGRAYCRGSSWLGARICPLGLPACLHRLRLGPHPPLQLRTPPAPRRPTTT